MVIIGTSFALNMIMDYKSSGNLAVAAQAKAAAEAGLNVAIISARNLAETNFTGVPAATMNGSLGNVGRGNTAAYSVKITDTASQTNVNAPNAPAGGYLTKEQVIDALPGATLTVRQSKFNKIADYITVNSYIDQNSESTTAPPLTGLDNPPTVYQAKAPININSASSEVLQAALRPVLSSQADLKAAALAGAIIANRPFTTWNQFNQWFGMVTMFLTPPFTGTEVDNVMNNANPNRVKPASYSTDFCFQPNFTKPRRPILTLSNTITRRG